MEEDDGWEILRGPPQHQSVSEKNLYAFCTAAQIGNIDEVFYFFKKI